MTTRPAKAADGAKTSDWATNALAAARQRHVAGDVAAAFRGYRRILTWSPANAQATHLLGVIELQQDRFAQASALFFRSVRLDPHLSEAWNNLAVVLKRMGRVGEASYVLKATLTQNPQSADAWINLATSLSAIGRHDEAIRAAERAIRLVPSAPSYFNERALVLLGANRRHEAHESCRRALQLLPTFPEAAYHLGLILGPTEPALSEACYRQAIALRPSLVEAWVNLGAGLVKRGELEQGAECFRRALTWQPSRHDAWNNLGHALRQAGRIKAAIACYGRAAALHPAYAEPRYNRALANLVLGNFAAAWEDHEWRWKVPGFPSPTRSFSQPLWTGERLAGRKILLHTEQGFGDSIQFLRYVPLVAQRGPAQVILEVHPELFALAKDLPGADAVVKRGDPLPAFDVQAPLLSLPLAFKTSLKTIPAATPYLKVEEARRARLQPLLRKGVAPRIGLVWAGNPRHGNDHNRSLPLTAFAPMLNGVKASWVSLQMGPRQADIATLGYGDRLQDFSPHLTDFADTAAVMAMLDLVICVDTSVAHLAGALNRPVWVLIPYAPDWRWMLQTEESPWYPSMRLFRQAAPGKWDAPLATMLSDLVAWTTPQPRRTA
jgi:tetratricopeptide (TPR) repeat protein